MSVYKNILTKKKNKKSSNKSKSLSIKSKTKTKLKTKNYNLKKIKKINRPSENPNNFELNKFKSKKNNLFRVSLRNNKKVWRKASKKEVKCYKYLQSKISYNLEEYKKGKYKTSKQAIAISYNQAKKKYPECNL